MRILLDEMYPSQIAEHLRERGHDALAVVERMDLRRQPDRQVFAAAQRERRAVVTENIRDFAPLAGEFDGRAEPHHGLILVDPEKFHRGSRRTIGRMVTALDRLLTRHGSSEATSLIVFL